MHRIEAADAKKNTTRPNRDVCPVGHTKEQQPTKKVKITA